MPELNIDHSEIEKFEVLASRWWDKESKFKPLHEINPLRANWIDRHSPVSEMKLLDVGCGGGILTESMAQRGAVVTGIDMGKAPLAVAKLHSLETGISVDYQQCTAEEFSVAQSEQFDIVTCLEMLEHVPDPSSVIRACSNLVKPGGHLYFSTINRNILAKGTHDYSKFIRPSEISSWLRDSNLEQKSITGLTYNPFRKTYRLNENDIDVNYMIYAKKPF